MRHQGINLITMNQFLKSVFTRLSFLLAFLMLSSISLSQSILRQTTGLAGGSNSILLDQQGYLIQQSIGQASVIGIYTNSKTELRQGFIQPFSIISFEKEVEKLHLDLFPNPFKDEVTIVFERAMDQSIYIQVFDIMGRIIIEETKFVTIKTTIKIPDVPNGTYLLRIVTNNQQYSTQIQKL